MSIARTVDYIRKGGLAKYWRDMQYIDDAKWGRMVGIDWYVARPLTQQRQQILGKPPGAAGAHALGRLCVARRRHHAARAYLARMARSYPQGPPERGPLAAALYALLGRRTYPPLASSPSSP